MKKRIRVNIQNYPDRINMVIALANAGIPVFVEKEIEDLTEYTYYVVFNIPDFEKVE